ncbi:unnamed protein product [Paramecium sonneborni]|uniref:Uncharacterized protein n=1 Tax=Paramecium sonneborni TaxID=65129 RepID=A0A8S1MC92_9CILI|nr:unnamed protein product [Paramecium sonneborni]
MNDQNIKLKLQKLFNHIKQKEQKSNQLNKLNQECYQVGVNDAKIGQTAYARKVILDMRKPQ